MVGTLAFVMVFYQYMADVVIDMCDWCSYFFFFFFFKQKTAYEIYQCDWSSDVCSSDLLVGQQDGGERIARIESIEHHSAAGHVGLMDIRH